MGSFNQGLAHAHTAGPDNICVGLITKLISFFQFQTCVFPAFPPAVGKGKLRLPDAGFEQFWGEVTATV